VKVFKLKENEFKLLHRSVCVINRQYPESRVVIV